MGEYHIVGGNKISGDVSIGGAKNSILPILAATVLSGNVSIIHNCPRISDTFITIEILEAIGCVVIYEDTTIVVNSKNINIFEIPENLVTKMRSSIIFLGSLIGRFNEAKINYPGGCELGLRPIDIHLKGLKKLGAKISDEHGAILCKEGILKGTNINLNFPSVGAVENLMIASVLAKGETTITNCAKEPEIVDLQNFLVSMGADIKGAGTDTIVINGVNRLHSTEYTIMPDRIVAGTFLVASAITNGELTVNNIDKKSLIPITSELIETGCKIYFEDKKVHLKPPRKIKPINKLITHPHPGFPTDMQAQFVSLLSISTGSSTVIEKVFESRNKHISELIKMGANISLSADGMSFFINGVNKLSGTTTYAKDLRGGAALIIAGLVAEGETIVKNSIHVERGYQDIETTLSNLGGNIKFIK